MFAWILTTKKFNPSHLLMLLLLSLSLLKVLLLPEKKYSLATSRKKFFTMPYRTSIERRKTENWYVPAPLLCWLSCLNFPRATKIENTSYAKDQLSLQNGILELYYQICGDEFQRVPKEQWKELCALCLFEQKFMIRHVKKFTWFVLHSSSKNNNVFGAVSALQLQPLIDERTSMSVSMLTS